MRIALDATYSIGANLSGVGVYSREILAGLAAAHREASYLFCYRPHRFLRSFREPLPPNAHRRLLGEHWIPRSDLYHGLNQRLPTACPRRTVATFHDLFVITGEYSTPEFRARFEEQAREAAAHADLVIAVSEFTAGQVEHCLGVERSRIRVIHHGVRPPRKDAASGIAREPVVLHVGALQKRKNIVRLVRAFESLGPEWRLVLAGSAGFGADEALHAIQASPARDRIELPGYVSDLELDQWYARASIFAFPSLDEGFGMPVLDAMARGVPVLTSNGSALREVSGQAALQVDPQDEEEIAVRLREMAGSEELRNELSNRGRRHAASFSWEAAVSRTWAVYSELLPKS
ncbi:MAG TPA: glycosyltransferase family 1 protein [Bryobacteraceae bacterium]|nr:glycosyltransferase family 1 protein [Bryobacteraceae bacterium]